ncbi:MAG: TonB-dependent receptor [Flavobacterium sp.]
MKVYRISKVLILLASLVWMPFFSCAQTYEIQGTIFDSIKKPIVNSVVLASDTADEANILAYNSSDDNGNYKLIVKNNLKLDSIWLIVRHISYKPIRIKIPLKNIKKDFTLYSRVERLDEVLVAYQKTVQIKGDTITYNVKGIKSEKDYTIEEVIKRIPGVTISESGQIKYQDKPISHLYINGVDLLEGRYNIATQGIPADAVKEIDVLKNHNHERIDIGRTESDAVAFNLKIREDISLFFGSINGDAGLPLITGQIEATPIYLKDEYQNIGSFKLNNLGKTLRDIGSDLILGNINISELKLDEASVIRAPNINGVILSDKYWLDNDSYAVTNDAIHKKNDSTLLKWNVNYLNELSKIESKSSTVFLSNNQSSVVVNRSRNELRRQRFQAGVNQEINKRNFYLKNVTNYKYADNTGIESILLNDNELESTYRHSDFQVSNSTVLKTLVSGDNIIHGGLITQYEQNSEELNVIPPVFESLFNNNTNNDVTIQNVHIKKFNIGAYATYAFKWLNLKWNAGQTLGYNKFKFESNLKQFPEFTNESFPFKSEFDYQRFSTSSKINSNLDVGSVRFSWALSADFITLNTEENYDESIIINDSYLFLQPYFSIRYKINSKWILGSNYFQNNKISDFSELYTPFILTSFNTLVQNPNYVNKIKTQSVAPYLSYSNILKSFFFSIKGSWNNSKSDVTFSNVLSDEGFIITDVVKLPNSINNYGLSVNLTKGFLGSFKSDLTYAYNYAQNNLFFNEQLLDAVNRLHAIDFQLTWDSGIWYSLEYVAKLNFGSTQLPNNEVKNSAVFQTANLDFYTSSTTRLHFGMEYARAEISTSDATNNNALFNMSFFYKPSKKLFLRTSLLNVFDTPFFTTNNSSANYVNFYQFSLRQRQFTIGLTYSL